MPVSGRVKCVLACWLILSCWLTEVAAAPDFSGVWQGGYSSYSGDSGSTYANITQTESSLSGTLSVTNTECGDFSSLPLTGTVSGNFASFRATAKCPLDNLNYSLLYTQGEITGNTMDGYYAVSGPDYYDSGTFSLSKLVYTIEATAGAGGTIAPSGSVSVNPGASQLFTVTANAGYSILDVKVDGTSVGAVTGYTFTNLQANHAISASFYAVAPVAGFSATPTSGRKPLTVSFTGTSSGAITSRSWNFGDGSTSTASNPSHTYWRPGTYTVTLTVNGPGGSDVEAKVAYITVELGGANPSLPLLLED